MGTILRLAQLRLDRAKRHVAAGSLAPAIAILKSVLRLDLPANVTHEVHDTLAHLYEQAGDFLRSRRHLLACLAAAPQDAGLHHRQARLLEIDETTGDSARALRHYARAAKLNPTSALYRRDYGLCLLHQGRAKAGVRQLEAAYELEPANLDNLRALALGLVDLGKAARARKLLAVAAFRHVHNSAFEQVRQLVGFAILRREQEAQRRRIELASDEPAVVLPFLAPVRLDDERPREEEGTILRLDGPSTSAPHVPRPARFGFRQSN